MLRKLLDWFTKLWRDDVPEFIGDAYELEYEDYARHMKIKYGIAKAFADEDEREERWTK